MKVNRKIHEKEPSLGIFKNLWKEITVPFKALCYNEKIEGIIQRHNPPSSYSSPTQYSSYEDKWKPVLDELLTFAKNIKLPMYHLYVQNDRNNSANCVELVTHIREYAQSRFGQLIGLVAIIISCITLIVSIAAVFIALFA